MRGLDKFCFLVATAVAIFALPVEIRYDIFKRMFAVLDPLYVFRVLEVYLGRSCLVNLVHGLPYFIPAEKYPMGLGLSDTAHIASPSKKWK
jgi:hypothetical protein